MGVVHGQVTRLSRQSESLVWSSWSRICWGQSAERMLPTVSAKGAVDPGDDPDGWFLAGGPEKRVHDVVLQQGGAELYRGVIAGSTYLADINAD